MKRRLLTAIIALAAYTVNAQWINQNVPLVYEGFVDGIKVVDANTSWGTTYSNASGTLTRTKDFVRTIDGGATWTKGTIAASPVNLQTANIYPIDAMTCYSALFNPTAAGGKVYKTTDGGTTWAQVGANMFTSGTSFADFVYFWNAQNGMAMGDPAGTPLKYEIYLTSDAGVTWVQVPGANLPALTDPAEYGIVDLYDAVDGHVWFGTTYGDIYHSADGGNTWTKSFVGFPPYNTTAGGREDITKVAFTDTLNGLALQYDGTTLSLASTNDGGLTWTIITPSGNVYPGDLTGVPGSDIFVSAGSSAAGFGTTYSLDNGLTWTDLDATSHTSVDFADSSTGFSGEYIASGAAAGGAWKWAGLFGPLSCGSAIVTAGVGAVNDPLICYNDTLTFSVTGAMPPTDGVTHGFSVIVSSTDLMQSNDPINQTGVLGGTGVITAPGTIFATVLPNDGTVFPAGIYYFTPVVYGNATGTGNVTSLTLDPACTTTGVSVMVNLLADGDPLCTNAIAEIPSSQLTMNVFINNEKSIDVKINSTINGKTNFNIYDVTGRNVFTTSFNVTQGLNHQVINVGNLGEGAYIIKAQTGSTEVTSKLVKVQ